MKTTSKVTKLINFIIKEEIRKLTEADDEPSLDLDTPDDSSPETDDSSSADADGGTNDSGDSGGLDLGGDSSGSDDSTGDELDTDSGDDGLDLDSGSSGGLGGGSFGGGGGGGFDFGDDSSSGDDSDSDREDDKSDSAEMSPATGDPITDTISLAKEVLKTTSDHNRILSAIKAKIQSSFSDWSEAEQVVYDLWDTEDPTLKIVASKLLLFIDQN